ncbi:MAG TPA: gluconate 2-dehydrogenase subunit 3 family protein [Gemmatimonadaceae bacterium]|nr:gluconate 2-dehydrogenase subunit 3 family protein [Gemmatimonadaceae bacterium]
MANQGLTEKEMITRREAILRVSAILGGIALIGGESLLTGCRTDGSVNNDKPFTTEEIAFLDEVADTILPTTSTPGAKAAQTGAFMAMMVRDTYDEKDRKTFRDGMQAIDDATKKAHNVGFMQATPQQRLSVLEQLDRDQKSISDTRETNARNRSLAWLSDQRSEGAAGGTPSQTNPAAGITEDPPKHYFRMMKELTLLGYFTSEIGMTQAQRYIETPGRYDPCVPYAAGEKNWAGHA